MNADKIRALLHRLNENLYEKEHITALSFLTAVSGESIFFLGPPGVAKSMIARRLSKVFRDSTAFEYLMSRFSTPDEIFGPVSISKLKDEDSYERTTQGYLPEATVVFLDEIWKAGPSIQNALLTVLNEKIFRNGKHTLRLPLQLTVAASNELPAEGEGLEALWDRFLVRCLVGGIRRTDLFDRMVAGGTDDEPFRIPEEEQLTAEQVDRWRDSARTVDIPEAAFSFIHKVRAALLTFRKDAGQTEAGDSLYVSDRRWKKMVGWVRTAAFLNGASHLRLVDLLLLEHCLWEEPGQIKGIRQLLADTLADVVEEQAGLPLLADRIRVLRDEACSHSVPGQANGTRTFRTVKSFFYQVDRTSLSRPILIYISEYGQLDDKQPVPFVLVDDKRKTGAQLLRLYQKSRYPNVFPKDLLEVCSTPEGIRVNGTSYPLVAEADAPSPPLPADQEPAAAVFSPDTSDRISAQIEQARERLAALRAAELEAATSHLFLDEEERRAAERAFQKAAINLDRTQHEWKELVAAHEKRK